MIWAASGVNLWSQSTESSVDGENQELQAEIIAASDVMSESFNAGNAEKIVAMFLTNGELIDEEGTVYQGHSEIKALLDQFFEKFSAARVNVEIESIREVGPVVIEEGTRTTTREDAASQVQYTRVWTKAEQGWRVVSLRDYPEEILPTPGEMLQPLEWLVGDWLNEGADARVKINYRWSEDENYLLGEFQILEAGKVVAKTSQRIAWDPLLAKPRSWLFDSDGGFSEAVWTLLDDGRWLLRSSAIQPDGSTGSATVTISQSGEDRFIYAGSSRLVGDLLEDDFELTVVRQPPAAVSK
jgi:uncharacterized protein (TIGR02246 family)